MSQLAVDRPFSLGPITVYPTRNKISRDGQSLNIEPRHMDVLVCLAEAGGAVVSRDVLIERCWSGAASDEALSTCIYALRRAIGKAADDSPIIETVRKRGYRLTQPVAVETPGPRFGMRAAIAVVTILVGALLIAMFAQPESDGPAELQFRRTPVTSLQGSELDPAISPDRQWVAFSWDGAGGSDFDIYRQRIDGTALTPVVVLPGNQTNPAWSPSGQTIAFVSSGAKGPGIYIMGLSADEPTLLTPTRTGDGPDLQWSADGRWIYFVDRPDPKLPYRVMRVDTFTGESASVTDAGQLGFGDRDFSLSPDGGSVAVARAGLPGAEVLAVQDLESKELRVMNAPNLSMVGIDWSASGDYLIFGGADAAGMQLWSSHVASGVSSPLGIASSNLFDGVLLDDESIIAEHKDYEVNIWRRDPGADPVHAIASTRWDNSPAVSPDGGSVAFVSNRDGASNIWLFDRASGAASRISNLDQSGVDFLSWSPDGEHLAFTLLIDGRPRLFALHVASGSLRRFEAVGRDALAPTYDPTGDALFYGAASDEGWQLWRMDLDTGDQQRLTREGGVMVRFLLESGAGVYTRPGDDVVRWLADESPYIRCPGLVHWRDWALAEGRIYCRSRHADTNRYQLLEVRADADPVVVLELSRYSQLNFAVDYSPVDDTLWYSQIDREESDLVRLDGLGQAWRRP